MIFSCLICTSETYEKVDRRGRVYHFCPQCLFVSLDKRFFISFEEERRRYDLHYNDSQNNGYVQWLMEFVEVAVKPNLPRESRILDFGSGPNPLLQKLLIEQGYDAEIYDIHYYDHIYSGLYDAIISTEVIEHIPNPLNQIKALKAYLKRSGFIIIKTSFRPLSDDAFLKWWYKEDITHISFFSSHTMKVLAEISGLTVHFCDNQSIIILKN